MAARTLKAISLTNLLVWERMEETISRSSAVMNGSNDDSHPTTECWSALGWKQNNEIHYSTVLSLYTEQRVNTFSTH